MRCYPSRPTRLHLLRCMSGVGGWGKPKCVSGLSQNGVVHDDRLLIKPFIGDPLTPRFILYICFTKYNLRRGGGEREGGARQHRAVPTRQVIGMLHVRVARWTDSYMLTCPCLPPCPPPLPPHPRAIGERGDPPHI